MQQTGAGALLAFLALPAFLCAGCGGGSRATEPAFAPIESLLAQQAARTSPAMRVQLRNPVPSAAAVSNEVLLNWAESTVPDVFSGHSSTLPGTWNGANLVYRHYPKTDSYLLIMDNGTTALLQPSQRSQAWYLGSAGQFFCQLTDKVFCRPTTPFFQPSMSGYWPAGTYVARNQAEWEQVWTALKPASWNALASPTPPTFNFSRFMVLGVSLGEGTDCGAFNILRVIEEDQALRVEHGFWYQPDRSCAAIISPILRFVAVPRSDKPVYFVAVNM